MRKPFANRCLFTDAPAVGTIAAFNFAEIGISRWRLCEQATLFRLLLVEAARSAVDAVDGASTGTLSARSTWALSGARDSGIDPIATCDRFKMSLAFG
jgi:hypothetical protein